MKHQRAQPSTSQFRNSSVIELLVGYLTLSSWITSGGASSVEAQIPVLLPPLPQPEKRPEEQYERTEFQLRHIFHHGTHKHPGLHRVLDVPPNTPLWISSDETGVQQAMPKLWVQPTAMKIQRLADRSPARVDTLQRIGRARGAPLRLPMSAWAIDNIKGPNYTDRETVLSFARMALDSYVEDPTAPDWRDIGNGFNYTQHFGWKGDGLRGHVFADTSNKTVVIGMKGTTPAVFDGEDTTTNDKVNDNLFFSCCCGVGGSITPARWLQVCDCKTSTYTCNATCLTQSLRERDKYYGASIELYHNVTALYPDADIWLAGHSLGGAVASLLSITYGLPTINFGAPGDQLPATRLGLPLPPIAELAASERDGVLTGAVQYGHNADPIYMGSCAGWNSFCSIAGYAMESVCHTGLECTYDTVRDKGWRNNMLNHRMLVTLSALESYPELAKCSPVIGCTDCFNWKYIQSNGSYSTTTTGAPSTTKTSDTYTQTRTRTCEHPGWWGCLDETTTSTTSPSTTSSSTSSTSTSTCQTPGWFGCRDPTTTTATTERTTSSTSKPTAAPTITPKPTKTSHSKTTTSASTTSCRHPSLFWGCKDDDYKDEPEPPDDPWNPELKYRSL